MDDGKTHIVKYPYVGAVCALQLEDDIGNSSLVYLYEGDKESLEEDPKAELDCKKPFHTELGVPYVYKPHCMKPALTPHMEDCPIDERRMLVDGRTVAVPYPKPGFNCTPFGVGGLSQIKKTTEPPTAEETDCKAPFKTDLYKPFVYKSHCMNPPLVPTMEHCPIDERKMLADGRTKAVAYPKPGFNCNPFGIAAQTPHSLL